MHPLLGCPTWILQHFLNICDGLTYLVIIMNPNIIVEGTPMDTHRSCLNWSHIPEYDWPKSIHQVTKKAAPSLNELNFYQVKSWVILNSRLWIPEITKMNETCNTKRLSVVKEISCMCRLRKTNLKSNELRKKVSKKGKKMLVSPIECLPSPCQFHCQWFSLPRH